jgi:hypothetical protein
MQGRMAHCACESQDWITGTSDLMRRRLRLPLRTLNWLSSGTGTRSAPGKPPRSMAQANQRPISPAWHNGTTSIFL